MSFVSNLFKLKHYLARRGAVGSKRHEWFTGDYKNFAEARANCSGYDAPRILDKVRDALLKVKRGEAVYERDSVLFDKIHYSLPLLVFLLYAATQSKNRLNLLDFGGSLGSTYFQNRKFLKTLASVKWSIVEQTHFVKCGQKEFADDILFFFDSIADCAGANNPNTLLLSSVLPYLPEPYSTLKEIMAHGFQFIIIDRTPFFTDKPDRLTIEHVPADIYQAEYPAWFFNLEKFLAFMAEEYSLFESFDSWEQWHLGDAIAQSKCMLFIKK